MALSGTEHWDGGFVVDSDSSLVVTTSLSGAVYWGGFLRDPDGRLVILYA